MRVRVLSRLPDSSGLPAGNNPICAVSKQFTEGSPTHREAPLKHGTLGTAVTDPQQGRCTQILAKEKPE